MMENNINEILIELKGMMDKWEYPVEALSKIHFLKP
jgi:hypothetical protein